MLVEEGRLNHKLNELDKLERSAINNPNPAWSVNSYYLLLLLLIHCRTVFKNVSCLDLSRSSL